MQGGGRTILAQGDLDGACFLYSLANAARCLVPKSATPFMWTKLLSAVGKSARNYLDGRIGTEPSDHDWQLQQSIAQQYMDILCPKNRVIALTFDGLDGASVGRYVTRRSVVVMPEKTHWSCLVEVRQEDAYVACSARWGQVLESQPKHSLPTYVEDKSPRLKRTYNLKRPTSELKLFEGRAIKLTLSSSNRM